MHNAVGDGLGKIGVIVGLESPGQADELVALGRQVAMHIAASNPQAVDPAGLDPQVVAREKDILADKFRQQGKPEAMIAKIVESGLKTFYKEVCLLEQPYIHDARQDRRRRRSRRRKARSAGRSRSPRFVRYALGEGHRAPRGRFRGRGRRGRRSLTPSAGPRGDRTRGEDAAWPCHIYRRVIVKLSGEALAGPEGFGIHQPTIDRFAADHRRGARAWA